MGPARFTAQGVAIRAGAREVIKKGIEAAAAQLETAAADIAYEDGTFTVKGTDKQRRSVYPREVGQGQARRTSMA